MVEVTEFVLSLREKAFLYGDHSTYRTQLSRKLLNTRKRLNIATKNRGKFSKKPAITGTAIAEHPEYLHHELLTAERAWAHAMAMKASHSADTKGMTSKTRSHIVSRLEKAARVAERLVEALESGESGANIDDVLNARAYAALLKGAALFEKQSWEPCLQNYSICRIIYSALTTRSDRGDIFRDLLSETIDPSIRYAAYQLKIPRTLPIPAIARKAFIAAASPKVVDEVREIDAAVLDDSAEAAKGTPTTLTWRGREVKIEDAAIADAWASVGAARDKLTEKLASSGTLHPKDMAANYDDILAASQDAVDATKQAIDELRAEGVTQGDARMQSLQITRTAVSYEMISWRIGRNRVLVGENDGAKLEFGSTSRRKKKAEAQEVAERSKDEAPGRQIARLKEKAVLYDGILQSIESIKELPGVANDESLSNQLDATSQYFTALKSLAIARSHTIAGNPVNALALIKHALDLTQAATAPLSSVSDSTGPRNIQVTAQDVTFLRDTLTGELHRARALVEIFNSAAAQQKQQLQDQKTALPLLARLSVYPASGSVDLNNIVTYPPRLEPFPVKPLFLDTAWNYVTYPSPAAEGGAAKGRASPAPAVVKEEAKAPEAKPEQSKPAKKGWFGFGR